jgi:hypothetical protein
MIVRLAGLVILLLPSAAGAAVVRALDGQAHEGEVRISGDGLEVRPADGGDAIRLQLAEVLLIDQRPGATLVSTAADPDGPEVREQARWADVSRWKAQDIGQSRPPGRFTVRRGVVEVEAGGEEIGAAGKEGDHFFFVHRPLKGDGALVARVAALTYEQKAPRAGIMLRNSLDSDAAHVMLSLTGHQTYFQSRSEPGGQTPRQPCGDARPKWMKLSRAGSRVTASISDDGMSWRKVGEQKLAKGGEALVGLAVASRREGASAEVAFEGVDVTVGADASSLEGATNPWVEKVVERGVVFRDGSLVAADIRGADDTSIRFVRRGQSQEQSAPLTDVAQILLRKPRRPLQTAPSESGVILTGGDFVAGELKKMKDSQLTLSSVLFGLRRLDLHREVAAVVLRRVAPGQAAYEIETREGSLYLARRVSVESGALIAHSELMGEVKLSWGEVEELRAGTGRLVPLTELKGARATGPADAVNAASLRIGPPIELAGKRYDHGISMAAGIAVEWQLDGAYSVLMGEVGVPADVLPACQVRFVVTGDGKELWRSPLRSSVDSPQEIAIVIKGVRRLALHVEAGAGQLAAAGGWANVSLVKAPRAP